MKTDVIATFCTDKEIHNLVLTFEAVDCRLFLSSSTSSTIFIIVVVVVVDEVDIILGIIRVVVVVVCVIVIIIAISLPMLYSLPYLFLL